MSVGMLVLEISIFVRVSRIVHCTLVGLNI